MSQSFCWYTIEALRGPTSKVCAPSTVTFAMPHVESFCPTQAREVPVKLAVTEALVELVKTSPPPEQGEPVRDVQEPLYATSGLFCSIH